MIIIPKSNDKRKAQETIDQLLKTVQEDVGEGKDHVLDAMCNGHRVTMVPPPRCGKTLRGKILKEKLEDYKKQK